MGTNTGIGIGIGIPFKNNALGGDKPYFPPELEARMIGVWDNYGKKNTDADRNIIKNKIPNAGGDLEILNSAYKLNSGFGEYKVDFTVYNNQNVLASPNKLVSIAGREIISLLPYIELSKAILSYKIKVTGLIGELSYWYRNQDGSESRIIITEDGIYQLPTCYNVENGQGSSVGFNGYSESSCTIEQIPEFEGALVTDGINDIVASIKTLEEWNIGDKGITIVSMIHQINTNTNNFITTNNIRTDNKVVGRNIVSNIEKTGIYGWYKENIQSNTINVINNILGDENDYISHSSPSTNINPINNSKFYVQGYAVKNGFAELSSVAHYWTFAVLGKATADEINLIIAKYNLDRTLKPDILCNITKQGITNDNHADFNDKLIDYSGNGRDIQMYNLAWGGNSGIGNYATNFNDWQKYDNSNINNNSYSLTVTGYFERSWLIWSLSKVPVLKVKISGIAPKGIVYYTYPDNGSYKSIELKKDGIYTLPAVEDNSRDIGFRVNDNALDWIGLTITQIPSHEGALCLDGVNDFGQFVGDLGLKDYTFIMDREYLSLKADQVPVISSINPLTDTPFIFEHCVYENRVARPFSFGKDTVFEEQLVSKRLISYQSTYKYNGKNISKGTSVNTGNGFTIGRYGDDRQYTNFALYFLMLFPYSMSEFLIERQLKKHKLGTLYPNMVEFRPVIKANANYNIFYTALLPLTGIVWEKINIGDYIPVGRRVAIQLSFDNEASELVSAISSQLGNISITKNSNNKGYTIFGDILKNKSPQKINITIDEYIRYEDIVQPYPVLLRFNDENGNEVSWGGKFRVGSTITRIGSAADSNLLPNIYNIFGLLLNDNQVTSSKVIVEKTMVFKAKSAYIFDNNEPNCILSPRL